MTFTASNSRKNLPEKYWHRVLNVSIRYSRSVFDIILGLKFSASYFYALLN